jgi:hypothetical protein
MWPSFRHGALHQDRGAGGPLIPVPVAIANLFLADTGRLVAGPRLTKIASDVPLRVPLTFTPPLCTRPHGN